MPITIRPQGHIGAFADWVLQPLMYAAQGTFQETPQRTHMWNNVKLKPHQLSIDRDLCIHHMGDEDAVKPWWFGLPRFHVPILGGWRRFVALETTESGSWHVGWLTDHGFMGVSRIALSGPVRMTIGPALSTFFAVRKDGSQVPLRRLGEGFIGEAGRFRHLPLL